jgi:hypothetical protein
MASDEDVRLPAYLLIRAVFSQLKTPQWKATWSEYSIVPTWMVSSFPRLIEHLKRLKPPNCTAQIDWGSGRAVLARRQYDMSSSNTSTFVNIGDDTGYANVLYEKAVPREDVENDTLVDFHMNIHKPDDDELPAARRSSHTNLGNNDRWVEATRRYLPVTPETPDEVVWRSLCNDALPAPECVEFDAKKIWVVDVVVSGTKKTPLKKKARLSSSSTAAAAAAAATKATAKPSEQEEEEEEEEAILDVEVYKHAVLQVKDEGEGGGDEKEYRVQSTKLLQTGVRVKAARGDFRLGQVQHAVARRLKVHIHSRYG